MSDAENIVNITQRLLFPYCELCGRKTNTAWFNGNVMCGQCYYSQPKWLRDQIDAEIDAATKSKEPTSDEN